MPPCKKGPQRWHSINPHEASVRAGFYFRLQSSFTCGVVGEESLSDEFSLSSIVKRKKIGCTYLVFKSDSHLMRMY